MYKHLLMPLDLQDVDSDILAAVRELALHNAARVTLLHVVERIVDVEDPEMEAFYTRLESRARDTLQAVSSHLEEAGVESDRVVLVGRRSEEIVRYAAEHGIDLIALRSRSLHETPAGAWPTVSFQVAMLSPIPVLLLR